MGRMVDGVTYVPHSLHVLRTTAGPWRTRCRCGWRSGPKLLLADAERVAIKHAKAGDRRVA